MRISAIHRVIFLWDIAATVDDPTAYSDPFDILQPNLPEEADDTPEHSGELPAWLQGLGLEEQYGVQNKSAAN